MKNRSVVISVLAGCLFVIAVTTSNAHAFSPQRSFRAPTSKYNNAQRYNSVPKYNSVQQYNKVPAYNSVPKYNSVQPNSSRGSKNFPSSPYGIRTSSPTWYQSLTDEREHDFGIVATTSRQEHIFQFVNSTDGDLSLTSIRTSCGCTKPKILTKNVRPGDLVKVSAVFDTRNFYGKRGATLTVSLQKSGAITQYGEIQFSVKGEIRRDVVLNPGEIVFDNVIVSEGAHRTARMLYAGNPAWKIVEVKSTNPNVIAEAREVERNSATGRVTYDLVVNLKEEQDTGAFQEFLTIVTNDAKTTGMPVAVKGVVKPRIQVSAIQLGPVNKGQTIKKKLILQSTTAFAVNDIKSNDPRIKFEPVEGEKTLHILTYTLDTSIVGQIDEDLTIVTSDPNQPGIITSGK